MDRILYKLGALSTPEEIICPAAALKVKVLQVFTPAFATSSDNVIRDCISKSD